MIFSQLRSSVIGKYDFAFDQMVDGITVGVATGGMRLRFLTVATDAIEKTDYRLMAESKGNEAIVVLADTLTMNLWNLL